jgi:hypothetical protein
MYSVISNLINTEMKMFEIRKRNIAQLSQTLLNVQFSYFFLITLMFQLW